MENLSCIIQNYKGKHLHFHTWKSKNNNKLSLLFHSFEKIYITSLQIFNYSCPSNIIISTIQYSLKKKEEWEENIVFNRKIRENIR